MLQCTCSNDINLAVIMPKIGPTCKGIYHKRLWKSTRSRFNLMKYASSSIRLSRQPDWLHGCCSCPPPRTAELETSTLCHDHAHPQRPFSVCLPTCYSIVCNSSAVPSCSQFISNLSADVRFLAKPCQQSTVACEQSKYVLLI